MILMMHVKMKREEEEDRDDWPRKGFFFFFFTAYGFHLARLCTCTHSCIEACSH